MVLKYYKFKKIGSGVPILCIARTFCWSRSAPHMLGCEIIAMPPE